MGECNDVRRVAIACQGGGSHTAFTAGVLGETSAREGPGRVRGGRPERHLGRGGVRPTGLAQPLEGRRCRRGGGSRCILARQLRHGAPGADRQLLDRLGGQPAELRRDTGHQPLRQLFLRPGARGVQEAAGAEGRLPKRKCAAGRILPRAAGRGRGRAHRRVSDLQQQTGQNLRRDHPRFGCHPDTLSLRAPRRRGDLLGRALLAEPPGKGADRRAAGRDLGDPDKPQGARIRAEDGRRDSGPAQ